MLKNRKKAQGEDAIQGDDQQIEAMKTAETKRPEENDRFMEYLASEYRHYRLMAWILGGVGFLIVFIAVGLSMNGIMPVKIYNLIMSVAFLFILLMAITIFTRTRPAKRRMKQLKGEPLSTIHDENAPDGVRMEENPQFRDMDDLYKILERNVRTEVIPEGEEYRRLRRIWLLTFAAAFVIGAASLVVYYFRPELTIPASIMLLMAFALVIVAFYIDRTKMKPMRNEWAAQFGMSEMQLRDNYRTYKKSRQSDDAGPGEAD